MAIPINVFKSYDIRGLSPGEIDADLARRIGSSFVIHTDAKHVIVGKDMRSTTPELAKALIEGIRDQGANVTEIGLTTTPMFYFAVVDAKDVDGGIMVTASHNPSEYNGFKLVRAGAVPIGFGSGMEEIRDLAVEGNFSTSKTQGELSEKNVRDSYLKKVLSLVPNATDVKKSVVVDTGNGMAGYLMQEFFDRLKHEMTPLFFELDGTFPNHEANPIKEETLVALKKKVAEVNADIGVAYDGDGDRIGFVDEKGNVVRSDIVIALLAPILLEKHPGAPVMFDVRCSWVVQEEIERVGGQPIMSRVGHAHIKRQMRENGSVFAGELSGHFYFKDFFGVESSDLVMLLLIGLIHKTGQPLSVLVAPLLRYSHTGEINFKVEDKAGAIDLLKDKYSDGAKEISKIDGIRIEHDDWWVSVRPSNTEPLLRLNLEGKTRELMEEKRDEISAILKGLAK